MTQMLDKPTEQRFVQTGISWENFKVIQRGFAGSPRVRLFYYEGELEILSTSPEHSGGPSKLKRDKALGVQEVWFWENGEIYIYQLVATGDQKVNESQFIEGINLERLARYVAIEARPEAVREFR